MRTFTLALLAIGTLAPSASAQTEEFNWWLDWVKSRTNNEPIPVQIRSPQALPAKFNQPRQDLEQLQRQYTPYRYRSNSNQVNSIPITVEERFSNTPNSSNGVVIPSTSTSTIAPVSSQPPQIRQGLQRNDYIEIDFPSSPPNLPTRTEVEFIPRSALPTPLRTRYPGGPTVKETESRIVRRLCTEYKRGLTPGELDELARNLVEKNRLYLSGEGKSPRGYAIDARNTKKCWWRSLNRGCCQYKI